MVKLAGALALRLVGAEKAPLHLPCGRNCLLRHGFGSVARPPCNVC